MSHSHLKQIPNDPKSIQFGLNAKVVELRDILDSCDGDQTEVIRRHLKKAETKLAQHRAEAVPPSGITFAEVGFDRLVLDECHEFKNAEVQTKQKNLKGINTKGADNARDLQIKAAHLNRVNPRHGMMFTSGTPLANSISEAYVWMQYLMPDELKASGMGSFDAWLHNFAQIETAMESGVAGRSMKQTERIRTFKNASDLMRMYRRISDVKIAQQVSEIVRPEALRGADIVVANMSDDEWKIASEIDQRIDFLKLNGGVVLDEDGNCVDSYLHVMADAGKLAMDGRFVDDALEFNADGKIARFTPGCFISLRSAETRASPNWYAVSIWRTIWITLPGNCRSGCVNGCPLPWR